MKTAINKTLINGLPEGQDMDIYDTRLTGFTLRLRKSGRHSYRVNCARGKWATIGRITDLTPAEAREEAKKILGDTAKGIDVAAKRKRAQAATLRAFLDNVYLPWAKTHHRNGKATVSRLKACFDAELGKRPLTEITPWLIEKWRSKKLKAGSAQATINREVTTLKSALNRAVDWNVIDANPLTKIKPLKLDQKGIVRYLSNDEELRLRNALAARDATAKTERDSANQWRAVRGYPTMPRIGHYGDHLTPIVLLALNTGLRRGEIFNLRWDDLNFDRGMLAVRGSGAKSGQTRYVPLNAEAVTLLKQWPETDERVFPSKVGGKIDNIQKSWSAILKTADLHKFRFHDLRHTFASKLVMAGVDLNTVRELLGHADLTMTLRYAHLAPEHKADAVSKLNWSAA